MIHRTLAQMRREYQRAGLAEADLAEDWVAQFGGWLLEAVRAGVSEPNAMVLATADAAGHPSARTVLLKHFDAAGFVWYTNYASRKGGELAANPYASVVFPWHPIGRQVIACGAVSRLDPAESARYFAHRPRLAQLGAWASPQSRVISDRQVLEDSLAEVTARFPEGEPVPPPPHWGGLRLSPVTVEFWQGREGRLHDRLRFRLGEGGPLVERLAP